jgi:hypothetical protein
MCLHLLRQYLEERLKTLFSSKINKLIIHGTITQLEVNVQLTFSLWLVKQLEEKRWRLYLEFLLKNSNNKDLCLQHMRHKQDKIIRYAKEMLQIGETNLLMQVIFHRRYNNSRIDHHSSILVTVSIQLIL